MTHQFSLPDFALHWFGGAMLGAIEAHFTGNVGLAILWPTVVGYAREATQLRMKHPEWPRLRASAFWRWSPPKLAEWTAWPLGALVLVGLRAVVR